MSFLRELKGEFAVRLWLDGPEKWNKWIDDNPGTSVSFSNVKFSDFVSKNEDVSFCDYKFPKDAIVDFSGAKFNCRNVFFNGVIFDCGIVTFNAAEFDANDIWFDGTCLDCFNVVFSNTKFKANRLSFSNSKINSTMVDFEGVEFEVEQLNFSHMEFNSKRVSFAGTKIKGNNIDFFGTDFGKADVIFSNTEIISRCRFSEINADGLVYFANTQFYGDENIFEGASFGGSVSFEGAGFHKGVCSFKQATFKEHLDFSVVNIHHNMEDLSFRFTTFLSSCEFSANNRLLFIPDFTGTKTTNHFVLSGLNCEFQRETDGVKVKAVRKTDAERLCRLKEIAESNKDHSKALLFHSEEMRAKRWHQLSTAQSVLDILFDVVSRYGQSIVRPIVGVIFCMASLYAYTIGYALPNYGVFIILAPIVLAFIAYRKRLLLAVAIIICGFYVVFNFSELSHWVNKTSKIDSVVRWEGMNLTMYKTIPFIPSLRDSGKKASDEIIGDNKETKKAKVRLPAHYGLISTLFFTLPSFIFIFLIGLGLRNRFRL